MINVRFKLIIAYLYELFVHIIESLGSETVERLNNLCFNDLHTQIYIYIQV